MENSDPLFIYKIICGVSLISFLLCLTLFLTKKCVKGNNDLKTCLPTNFTPCEYNPCPKCLFCPDMDILSFVSSNKFQVKFFENSGNYYMAFYFYESQTIKFKFDIGQCTYLVVAGGGGGGFYGGGGGGGGGVLTGTCGFDSETPYQIIVGKGGDGLQSVSRFSTNKGGNSSLQNSGTTITAFGGGSGGSGNSSSTNTSGENGGSGGGAGFNYSNNLNNSTNSTGGSGVTGQGTTGGSSMGTGEANKWGGGGGGGAGSTGRDSSNSSGFYVGGGGGGGYDFIDGNTYGGGGGGSVGDFNNGTIGVGLGSRGGGGMGGKGENGQNGVANTGGGGGGGGVSSSSTGLAGGNGGSGIVILVFRKN